MTCPYCASSTVDEQGRRTALGYRTFRCSTCHRSFNERTGTAFNFLEFPTDVVLLVVRWRSWLPLAKLARADARLASNPYGFQRSSAPAG